jgi:hypothetical protein
MWYVWCLWLLHRGCLPSTGLPFNAMEDRCYHAVDRLTERSKLPSHVIYPSAARGPRGTEGIFWLPAFHHGMRLEKLDSIDSMNGLRRPPMQGYLWSAVELS